MTTRKPNQFRFVVPLAFGLAPTGAALLWLHLIDVVHQMAKLPPATIDRDIGLVIMGAGVIGVLASAHRAWADFVRGDYFLDLVEWQERRIWRG